ncbi:hypothetical protein L1987_58277 [Smallanthus sonchifolius]|uniref:Uncharacterized protein n=1 Tax=Smallanthus sonchifolius TaxID=185202 RepID=A0ACB9DF96_9ASTR|nr:hypothetical protein L1987_58277 [Smallanthus sonchifolius]
MVETSQGTQQSNQTTQQSGQQKRSRGRPRNIIFSTSSENQWREVWIIMVSCTDKLHEYIRPSITMKQFFDQY